MSIMNCHLLPIRIVLHMHYFFINLSKSLSYAWICFPVFDFHFNVLCYIYILRSFSQGHLTFHFCQLPNFQCPHPSSRGGLIRSHPCRCLSFWGKKEEEKLLDLQWWQFMVWACKYLCRSKHSLKRRLRIRTLQYGTAQHINELYDSVDPEVVLSLLVHKVITSFIPFNPSTSGIILFTWSLLPRSQTRSWFYDILGVISTWIFLSFFAISSGQSVVVLQY